MQNIYYSPIYLDHAGPKGHPESPERLEVIVSSLSGSEFSKWTWVEPRKVLPAWFEYAHTSTFIAEVLATIPETGLAYLDADTFLSPGTRVALLTAGGGLKMAVDSVLTEGGVGLCLGRPPGHHAERTQAMGFCPLNLLANAALYAHSLQVVRIAVLDFDVHHGNGTESVLSDYSDIFFASSYEEGIFPGGSLYGADEMRRMVPLPTFFDSDVFRQAWTEQVFPELERFAPDLIFLSAGFDAHEADPLANGCLDARDYYWFGEQLSQFFKEKPVRVIASLEGGYNLDVLGDSVAALARGLSGLRG